MRYVSSRLIGEQALAVKPTPILPRARRTYEIAIKLRIHDTRRSPDTTQNTHEVALKH